MSNAKIFYKDIGDYLSREEKLKLVRENSSMLNPAMDMVTVEPNEHGDWVNFRNDAFSSFIPIEPEKKFDLNTKSFFVVNIVGVATGRDAWVLNFSKEKLVENMQLMIGSYNEQSGAFINAQKQNPKLEIENFIDTNPTKISWTRALRRNASQNITHEFNENKLCNGLYRPFTKEWLYYDKPFIESPGIWSQILPTKNSNNIIICISCVGTNNGLSLSISEKMADYHSIGDTKCFPLYWYEKKENTQQNLFDQPEDAYVRRDAVSDFILSQAQTRYGPKAAKEDIFYYVYGILHSPGYRQTFANDLKKMLPRLPLVEGAKDFWAFSKAGRELAELHLNYEHQQPPGGVLINGKPATDSSFAPERLVVNKMQFPAKGQKDTILYNSYITISNIPPEAYNYIINGKSAIEWVMERYAVTADKDSGIKNNPNDWSAEHNNPRYILDLLLSVMAVSVKTVDIVAGLPGVEWGGTGVYEKISVFTDKIGGIR